MKKEVIIIIRKSLLLLVFSYIFQLSICQNSKSSFGIEFGFLNSDQSELNKLLKPQFDDITYSFGKNIEYDQNGKIGKVKQYSIIPTISISCNSKSFFKNKFNIDISFRYHYLKDQTITLDSVVKGKFIYFLEDSLNTNEYTDYNYGFKFSLFSFSIISYYNILNFKRCNVNLGVGLINTFGSLKQTGILVLGPEIEFNEIQVKTYDYQIGFISSCAINYHLTDRIVIKYVISYQIQDKLDIYKHSTYNNVDGFTEKQYIVPISDLKNELPRFNLKGLYSGIGINYIL